MGKVGGGKRFQEERVRDGEGRGGAWKKKKKKRVRGAPAFQVTPDLGLLCQPSARLSGGFVRASWLNGHPADRHVVYPLCVLWERERLCVCQCVSGERQVKRFSLLSPFL